MRGSRKNPPPPMVSRLKGQENLSSINGEEGVRSIAKFSGENRTESLWARSRIGRGGGRGEGRGVWGEGGGGGAPPTVVWCWPLLAMLPSDLGGG